MDWRSQKNDENAPSKSFAAILNWNKREVHRFLGGGGGGILWTDVKTQNEENSGDKEFVAKKIISQPNYMDQAPFLHLPYVLHFRWVTLL